MCLLMAGSNFSKEAQRDKHTIPKLTIWSTVYGLILIAWPWSKSMKKREAIFEMLNMESGYGHVLQYRTI